MQSQKERICETYVRFSILALTNFSFILNFLRKSNLLTNLLLKQLSKVLTDFLMDSHFIISWL
jgi:hypothetical protein